jgi:hypothetical protein
LVGSELAPNRRELAAAAAGLSPRDSSAAPLGTPASAPLPSTPAIAFATPATPPNAAMSLGPDMCDRRTASLSAADVAMEADVREVEE